MTSQNESSFKLFISSSSLFSLISAALVAIVWLFSNYYICYSYIFFFLRSVTQRYLYILEVDALPLLAFAFFESSAISFSMPEMMSLKFLTLFYIISYYSTRSIGLLAS